MKKKYDIDEGRVYMQGMSMGDIMTMMFSRVCGHLLAAADCTAGPSPEVALFNEDGSLKGYDCPVPMYQSRGELDNIVVAKRPGKEDADGNEIFYRDTLVEKAVGPYIGHAPKDNRKRGGRICR